MCVGKGNAFCAQLFACQLNQIVSDSVSFEQGRKVSRQV